MPDDTQRTIGEHGGRLVALERNLTEIRDDVRSIETKLDAVAATLNQAQGGWRTLMLIGGASATAGGLIVEAARFLVGPH